MWLQVHALGRHMHKAELSIIREARLLGRQHRVGERRAEEDQRQAHIAQQQAGRLDLAQEQAGQQRQQESADEEVTRAAGCM